MAPSPTGARDRLPAAPPVVVAVSAEAVRVELDRVLRSAQFREADRLHRFLTYSVEQTLQGEGDQLKEYRLGIDVFDREDSFDPRMDPIVRMSAMRLRTKLREYYESTGQGDPVRIDVPKGSYGAVFVPNAPPESAGRGTAAAAPERAGSRVSFRVWTLLLVIAVAATGAFTFLRLRRASTVPARKLMLAVLPFTNLSGDPQQEYFSDGLTEEVIARLGNLNPSHLGVIARTSVMGYKNTSKHVDQIARELGVDYVLESSVRRSGKQARITVQLIQVRDQTHLWAQSYDGEVGNVLQLEREIADATARAVSLNFNQGEAADRPAEVLIDPEAHEHYLKGRYFWRKHTTADLLRSVNEFQQALGQDRNYALAYVGLAETYNAMAANGQASPAEFLPKAISAAQSALRLDPALGEAHAVLAHIKFLRDWDYAGAEQEYRRALELSPGYVEAHHYYGIMLMFSGRLEEALGQLKQAQELDPLDSVNSSALGLALLYAHQDNLALEQARKILEWAPNDAVPRVLLGFCYMRAKRYEEAVPEMQRAAEFSGRDSEALGWLGWALAIAGRRSEALRILAELQSPSPGRYVAASDIAAVYAGLGDREKALEYLETAVRRREGDVVTIKMQFAFEPLHADPRFQELEQRVGLIPPSGS